MKNNLGMSKRKGEAAADDGSRPGDARTLQDQLAGALNPVARAPAEPAQPLERPQASPPVERRKPSRAAAWSGRILKSLVALFVLAAVVWAPMQVFLQASSVEAVVNARLIILRSPIEGRVTAVDLPAAGELVKADTALLRVDNPRIDHGPVARLERQIDDLSADRHSLEARLDAARTEAAALETQLAAFRKARIAVLDADAAMLHQRIIAAEEKDTLAASDATRSQTLRATGAASSVAADRAAHAARIAAAALAELRLQHRRIAVERQALSRGVYVGESYNDRPQSAQRLDEVATRITTLEAGIAADAEHQRGLRIALAQARQHAARLAEASIAAPVKARVWEVLASPGEQVNRGQDLVRLLSCGDAVVTASVSENVYNRLHAGMPARFVPRGAAKGLAGTIVNLTGMASASSNYAIDPTALHKEPYRVTVAVPRLAATDRCAVGRTGRVMFGQAGRPSSAMHLLETLRSYFQ